MARRRRRDTDGYRPVVWEGSRPQDDEAGPRACDAIEQQYPKGDRVESTPAIRAFVEAATAVWTGSEDLDWERSIWDFPSIMTTPPAPPFLILRRTGPG